MTRTAHQFSIAQFTAVQKLNQGEWKKRAEIKYFVLFPSPFGEGAAGGWGFISWLFGSFGVKPKERKKIKLFDPLT